ncbi:MAG: homocysteine S-methyltransferase family protein [Pirellulales bacterium]|nr:homocysteine S-methyltransferase family protein [Pirellulales bacterium]
MSSHHDQLEALLLADPSEHGIAVLADGATGSELQRRGVSTPLPLWSTAALLDEDSRVVLGGVHRDYLAAGAKLLTANTFRTHARNLRSSGRADQANELTRNAIEIARSAIAEHEVVRDRARQPLSESGQPILVAGSQAPLEDCYSPELTPPEGELQVEHRQMSANLADAGVDLIFIETMPTCREAVSAAMAAAETELPFAVSFVCTATGHLLSGEDLTSAVAAVLPYRPRLLGVNCAPAPRMAAALTLLKSAVSEAHTDVDLLAYGNIGQSDPEIGWRNTSAADPVVYARTARVWRDLGVKVIGGCCGTTPEHIAALRVEFARVNLD